MQVVANLQDGYNRAMERLAADLYAAEVHFVFELLQNADDCCFPDGVEPTLTICLKSGHLEFTSNEVGFERKNVMALCSIGESTKAKKAGYIGQKGNPRF